MKDFDEARNARATLDRTFRIGGETFEFRASVAPETIMRWTEFSSAGDRENAVLAAAQQRLAAAEKFDPPWSASKLAELQLKIADAAEAAALTSKSEREWLDLIDSTAMSIISPEYGDTWLKVRGPDAPNPLSLQDLQDLMEWLIGTVVNRPTEQPSDSASGDGSTVTSLTGVSSPQADTESTDSQTAEGDGSADLTLASSATPST